MELLLNYLFKFDFVNVGVILFGSFLITRVWRRETKEETKSIREEIASTNKRVDRLYEMFIDLLKGGKH